MRLIFLILTVFLLLPVFSLADEIEVKHELLSTEVYPGESARINLIIKNNQDTDDYFRVEPDVLEMYPLHPYSAFKDVIPPVRSQIDIKAHQQVTLPFDILIREETEPDRKYKINFNIKSGTNEELKVKYPIAINVDSPEELVKIETDMPKEIMPGEEVIFSVTLKNQANVLVDPLNIYIDSELFSKQYEEKIYPKPYEIKKTLRFTPPPDAKAKFYQLGIRAYKGKTLRGKLITGFKVAQNPDVVSKVETSSGFLTRTIIVKKSNNGNVAVDEQYTLPLTTFQKWMTSFNHEPQKIEKNQIEWYFTLKPQSDYELIIKTDYRILFFTIIGLLVISIMVIYFIRRGVMVKKSIFQIKNDKGLATEIKIMIHIINRTSRPIKDIKIIDILPNLLTLSKEFGTLSPSKIQKGEKSSKLVWNIDELEPKEERIISYKVKPKLCILGKTLLPAALLRYKTQERKIIDIKSNPITFISSSKNQKKEG